MAWRIAVAGGACRADTSLTRGPLQQGDLRQYVNDLLLKTGGVAAPGNPVITCKLYPVLLLNLNPA